MARSGGWSGKWADLQRQQRGADEVRHNVESDETVPAAPVNEEEAAAYTQEAIIDGSCCCRAATVAPPRPKTLVVDTGAGAAGGQSARSAGQWSALGRQWAGDPQDWDVHIVMPDSASLTDLAERYSRWALWINSDATPLPPCTECAPITRAWWSAASLALHEPHRRAGGCWIIWAMLPLLFRY